MGEGGKRMVLAVQCVVYLTHTYTQYNVDMSIGCVDCWPFRCLLNLLDLPPVSPNLE